MARVRSRLRKSWTTTLTRTEAPADARATAEEYKVTVRATDPSGKADNITVTIMAENVNEDPIVTGRAEISVPELVAGDGYTSLPDAPDDQPVKRREPDLY